MTYKAIVIIFSVLLFGCSSNRTPPEDKLIESGIIELDNGGKIKLDFSEYAYSPRPPQHTLNVVTRTDTSKAVGLKVLQAGTALLGVSSNIPSFSKEDLKGTNMPTEDVGKDYFYVQFKEMLKTQLVLKNEMDYTKYPITIYPGTFKLIYDGLTESTYSLDYSISITPPVEKISGKRNYQLESGKLCSGKLEGKPYSYWEEDNYLNAVNFAKETIDKCLAGYKEDNLSYWQKNFDLLSDQLENTQVNAFANDLADTPVNNPV